MSQVSDVEWDLEIHVRICSDSYTSFPTAQERESLISPPHSSRTEVPTISTSRLPRRVIPTSAAASTMTLCGLSPEQVHISVRPEICQSLMKWFRSTMTRARLSLFLNILSVHSIILSTTRDLTSFLLSAVQTGTIVSTSTASQSIRVSPSRHSVLPKVLLLNPYSSPACS